MAASKAVDAGESPAQPATRHYDPETAKATFKSFSSRLTRLQNTDDHQGWQTDVS